MGLNYLISGVRYPSWLVAPKIGLQTVSRRRVCEVSDGPLSFQRLSEEHAHRRQNADNPAALLRRLAVPLSVKRSVHTFRRRSAEGANGHLRLETDDDYSD